MAKMRVHELAKELGVDNKDMVSRLQGWGYDGVKTHSSTLEDDQVRAVRERILGERKPVVPVRPSSGVVIRRSKAKGETLGPAGAEAPIHEPFHESPADAVAPEPAPSPVEPAPQAAAEPATPATTEPAATQPVAATAVEPAPVATPATPEPAVVPLAAAPATPATPAPEAPRPTASRAVATGRMAPGFTPPGVAVRKQVPPATVTTAHPAAMRPGVSGNMANTKTAPVVKTTDVQAPPAAPPRPVPAGSDQAYKPDTEEIKMIGGVPHVVQKAPPGKPTANQAVVVSRPVYINKQFAPAKKKDEIPMAPGIRPGSLVRDNLREVQVINEGGRARELRDIKKGGASKPSGVRNEKVENYSKQDLIDLVRQRSYVPVIGRKKRATKRGKKTEITKMSEHKKVISIEETISLRELSEKMGVKSNELIRKLMANAPAVAKATPAPAPPPPPPSGMRQGFPPRAPPPPAKLFTINSPLDFDMATAIAKDYGWEVNKRTFEVSDFVEEVEDKPEDLKPRPPVVTVMGHVDHGKTSLLDALRSANVAEGEAGGITQHIGAYTVTVPGKGDLTFLDTPGHEAFSAMRSRGAQVTDIVILVVAADDGVQPQTLESIKHAKAADVAIVVAINKIDKPGTNPDKIKGDLAGHGLQPEDWGGVTPMIPVSARQKTNLDLLLENVLLQAEVMELSANPKKPAIGAVIESKIERGRGAVSTVLVQDGTLKNGDALVCGQFWGRVRTMADDKGKALKSATAGYPVQLVGLNGTPDAGDDFHVVPDEATAKKIADHRILKARESDLAKSARTTVEDLLKKSAADAAKEFVVILKADVQGSSEAVTDALNKLSGKKVVVNVVSKGVGGINESDVNQARASKALIVGFNVKPDENAMAVARQDGTSIKTYSIIYELLDDVRKAMEDLLEPIYKERNIGKAEVRQVFSVSKVGNIAGSLVVDGKVTRGCSVRVVRDRKVIYSGKLSSLKRFKDDVKEVAAPTECGISVEGFDALVAGDVLELFEIDTFRQKLE